MSKEDGKEKDVITAGDPSEIVKDEPIVKESGAEVVKPVPKKEELKKEVPKKKKREVDLKELHSFVKFLATRTMGPVELHGAKQAFPHIFED